MAGLYNMVFVLQFLVVIAIFLAKIYNIFTLGKFYDIKIAFLLFIGFFIAWLVCLTTVLLDITEYMYLVFFQLESWFIIPNVIFLIIEMFFTIKETAIKPVKAYKANQFK